MTDDATEFAPPLNTDLAPPLNTDLAASRDRAPAITIRDAGPDDLLAIGALNRGAVPAVSAVDDRELARLVDQSSATFVAVDDEAVVGFLIGFGPGADYASPNYRFFADRYAAFQYVDRVVVHPRYARQGIGGRLYDAFERVAVATRSTVITAEVNVRPPNTDSLAFHAARGFLGVGEQDTDGGAKRVRLLVRELR